MNEAAQLGPSQNGSVVLDIGGDRGALVILTPPDRAGQEIEISRAGGSRTHVAVRERRGPGGMRYAAIFPSLPAGDYTLWAPHGDAAGTVTVTGGEVTQRNWD